MLFVNLRRPRQHDGFAPAARRQREPSLGGGDAGKRTKDPAKAGDFDTQPGAMRFIGFPCAECARDERASRDVPGPRFTQRSGKGKQHRTPGERYHRARVAHDVAAPVDDEPVR